MSSGRPHYRPDIDGLRAVAIALVVAYHAYPGKCPAGFIGVDIFFVISGFLISGLLLQKEHAVSLVDFYARRVRRLAPALIIVLAACLAVGWALLLPEEFRELGRHGLAGAGFLSNIQLIFGTSYFDAPAEKNPLLHLWSLGVEEQFYLLWPVLLITARRNGLPLVAITLGIIIIISFAANIGLAGTHQAMAFFSPLTRMFELLAGALLVLKNPLAGHHRPRLAHNMSAALGCLTIAIALATIRPYSIYPGWWALLPVAGTVMIIAAGPDSFINRTVLAFRPFVFLGLISYPLYLWHWPLLSFQRITGFGTPYPEDINAAVGTSVVLAILTYLLVEKPARRQGTKTTIALLAALAVIAVLCSVIGGGLLASRFKPPGNSAGYDWDYPGKMTGFIVNHSIFYRRGVNRETAMILGDSNAEQYGPRISALMDQRAEDYESVIFATRSGCPPIPGLEENEGRCTHALDDALDMVAATPELDTIILASQWLAVFGDTRGSYRYVDASGAYPLASMEGRARTYASLEALIRRLQAEHKRVVLVLNIPVGEEFAPESVIRRARQGGQAENILPRAAFMARYGPVREALAGIAHRTGAGLIDPMDFLCNAQTCPAATNDGHPIYRDANHLGASFVRSKVHYLDDVLRLRQP